MLDALLTFGGIIAFLFVGMFFFLVFAALIRRQDSDDRVQQLDTEHQNKSHARDMERQALLWKIKETPEGQRSVMWAKYKELERLHAAMDDAENRAIAEAYSVIDDQTAYELENGINPYPKAQKQTRSAKLRTAKARR